MLSDPQLFVMGCIASFYHALMITTRTIHTSRRFIATDEKEHLHRCADALYDGLIGQVTFIICSII